METSGRITGCGNGAVPEKRNGGSGGKIPAAFWNRRIIMQTSGKTWSVICGLTVCLVSGPTTVRGQFDGGGGGIIVFDPSNFAKNTITAAQMIKQVLNSTKEVELMLQNLVRTGGSWEEALVLLRRLDEVLATGEALHYQLTDLDQRMRER